MATGDVVSTQPEAILISGDVVSTRSEAIDSGDVVSTQSEAIHYLQWLPEMS